MLQKDFYRSILFFSNFYSSKKPEKAVFNIIQHCARIINVLLLFCFIEQQTRILELFLKFNVIGVMMLIIQL